mgnify:CR=1 FL=1
MLFAGNQQANVFIYGRFGIFSNTKIIREIPIGNAAAAIFADCSFIGGLSPKLQTPMENQLLHFALLRLWFCSPQ